LAGILAPFDNVHPLPEDDGERFLSEYFEEQKVLNRKILIQPTKGFSARNVQ
jgi:hypothetical protein